MIVLSVLIFMLKATSLTFGQNHHHFGPSRGDYYNSNSHGSSYGGHSGGGSGYNSLGSFFDIALTGLAFLSFGIFLLNMLLNALFGSGYITGTIIPTLPGTIITETGLTDLTGGLVTTREGTRSGRRKRGTLDLSLDPVTSTDVIAKLVLKSIDAMVQEHECVQKVFCDGNKEAGVIGKGFQYLMPAYSLGATYIGRKIGLHNNMSNHLTAIFHGVGQSNCQSQFPQC